jgi:multicomponent Na+:H+ antiporter subunit F
VTWLALHVVLPLLALAMLLALVRIIEGPTVADRVVALDLIATIAVAMLGAIAIAYYEPILLQPALIVALAAFLGTIAFAFYMQAE